MRYILFLIIVCYFFNATASLNIEQLVSQMTAQDLHQTGLAKLSEKEKEYLQMWLQYKSPYYYIKSPIQSSQHQTFCYKTEPFLGHVQTTPNNPIDESTLIWDIALCSGFQHEAPYLKEWIEFYKLMGVNHFYLYNNLSNDNYYETLKDYITKGEVELFEYSVSDYIIGQNDCYTDAVMRSRGKARWLIAADSDLFFVPLEKENLVTLLKEYEAFGGLAPNCCNFGTNKIYSLLPGQLMTERLTKCMPLIDKHVKSIVKPHRVERFCNPHFPIYKAGYYAVDENFSLVEGPFNLKCPASKIRFNHYQFRTLEFLYNVSLLRHARFWAVINGLPLPLTVPNEIKEAYESVDSTPLIDDQTMARFIPFIKATIN
jgi:Glycosyltransferase family 92